MLQHGDLDDNQRIFIPTVIWLVGNVVTDLIITIVFTSYLARLKRGTTRSSTGSFANSLIRLAFETCAIPLFVTLFSAVMRAVSTLSPDLAHVRLHTARNCQAQITDVFCPVFQVATASICTFQTFDESGIGLIRLPLHCAVFIPSLYVLSFIYCIEGTANRKRLLDRDQREVEAGAAMSPPVTGSSVSRTIDRPRQQRMVLHLNEEPSVSQDQSKTPLSWEPPLAWVSTIEQDPEYLPKPSPEQSSSMKVGSQRITGAGHFTDAIDCT